MNIKNLKKNKIEKLKLKRIILFLSFQFNSISIQVLYNKKLIFVEKT